MNACNGLCFKSSKVTYQVQINNFREKSECERVLPEIMRWIIIQQVFFKFAVCISIKTIFT